MRYSALSIALAMTMVVALSLPGRSESNMEYIMMIVDPHNKYMCTISEGFSIGCEELGVHGRLEFLQDGVGEPFLSSLERILQERPDGIVIVPDSMEDINSTLDRIEAAGIPLVVSGGSPGSIPSSAIKIGSSLFNLIGTALTQSAIEISGDSAKAAVITKSANVLEADWFGKYMMTEMKNNPDKYKDFEIVGVLPCYDDSTAAEALTYQLLLAHPDLDIIISTTTVGLAAASKALTQTNSMVKSTGLGLPSEMSEYILNGVCPQMFLWNPRDIGYLAAYALYHLQQNSIDIGARFNAGNLGERIVEMSDSGEKLVRTGNLLIFDESNILFWGNTF